MTERLQCLSDCSGMMPEIVDYFDAASFAAKLLPARNAQETGERAGDFFCRQIIKTRGRRCHRCVMNIEFANKRDFENVVTEFESRNTGRVRNVSNSLGTVLRETHFNHLRQAISGDLNRIRIIAVHHDHTVLRNDIQQAAKAELYLIEIVEDIRVIELDVVHDDELRQVMNEL